MEGSQGLFSCTHAHSCNRAHPLQHAGVLYCAQNCTILCYKL